MDSQGCRTGEDSCRSPSHRYSSLPTSLKAGLDAVKPSCLGPLRYYPCLVRFKDGTELDRVFFGTKILSSENWGSGKSRELINVEDVASLKESPSRIPPEFANKLYEAGESGMGYRVFTVVFKKRFGIFPCRRDFVANAVDFIEYPLGRGPADIIGVIPHRGRRGKRFRQVPKYRWCLYSEWLHLPKASSETAY